MVVLKEGTELDPDDIRDYVKERVPPYKYPRIIQIVQNSLPESGTPREPYYNSKVHLSVLVCVGLWPII